ncbi:MAG: PAS domain-containing sensor histidine kinase [Desulfobacterales bacterium]|nr:PAS domain-containing sensor histidine kinase [Desulfobacteraceae bacterium]MBT4362865.1 PAS domain-containing sensor histidine kinase [Desulfobacteraceae bacterium]MBT7086721.1 PAS domain-containing sensor histidine kinase [Desulfobacterales bacterium]
MEKSDKFYSNIIDLLPVYLSIQNKELKIIYANRELKKDFGEVTGKLCHIAYKNSSKKCANCPVEKTFKDNKVHIGEKTVQIPGGKTSQLLIYSAPFYDNSNNELAVMELATNITKVKELQAELTGLGQSLAMMSHGIKNIMEGIQGGAYVIDEGIYDEDWNLVKKGWPIVKNNLIDISGIAQNVLYASKKRTIRLEKVFPADIVNHSINHFQGKADSHGIKLKPEINPDLSPVELDYFSIRRMLNNLVANAIDACSKDRKKKSHEIIVRADIYNELQFKFEVEDNGTGMENSMQKKIFGQFYSTKGSEGTGIGLAVVNKIVKEHNGKIEVDSESGKGSIFRVILRM